MGAAAALPAAMNAVIARAAGGPDMLACVTRPVPAPGPGQVLIRIRRAGVNPHDLGQRRRGGGPAGETDILGLEVAGEIVALGAGVPPARISEAVCALVPGGGYAGYCVADAQLALALPRGIDAAFGAALPEALFTAWFNLVELGRLARDDIVLVHGGTGNVGVAATQIARLLGARVISLAGDAERMRISRGLGAEASINYRAEDVVARVHALTDGRGVDVILDTTGGYAKANLECLAPDGRILHISSGAPDGFCPPLRLIMLKRAMLGGSLLRPLPPARKQAVARALHEVIWPHLGTAYRPLLGPEFALRDVAAAHAQAETGTAIGKIILRCDDT